MDTNEAVVLLYRRTFLPFTHDDLGDTLSRNCILRLTIHQFIRDIQFENHRKSNDLINLKSSYESRFFPFPTFEAIF